MNRPAHLTRRFFASLRARPLDDADLAWVQIVLTPEERAVWDTLGRVDRAESVTVARRAAHDLGPDADSVWLAAALLHDVGKTDSGLGTVGRVGATLIGVVASKGRARQFRTRVGRYLAHDDIGAALLERAGARPETMKWAWAHHRPEMWPDTGIPDSVARVLASADGE